MHGVSLRLTQGHKEAVPRFEPRENGRLGEELRRIPFGGVGHSVTGGTSLK